MLQRRVWSTRYVPSTRVIVVHQQRWWCAAAGATSSAYHNSKIIILRPGLIGGIDRCQQWGLRGVGVPRDSRFQAVTRCAWLHASGMPSCGCVATWQLPDQCAVASCCIFSCEPLLNCRVRTMQACVQALCIQACVSMCTMRSDSSPLCRGLGVEGVVRYNIWTGLATL